MSKLIDDLVNHYDYCNAIDSIPFPSISPQFMQGYVVKCRLYGFDIDTPQDCAKCRFNKIKHSN